MDLKESGFIGCDIENHWYYASKARALMSVVSGLNVNSVLDVGAGSGFFSKFLLRNLNVYEALCVDVNYKSDSDVEVFDGKMMLFRKELQNSSSKLVLLMDVLEHVDDDMDFLKQCVESVHDGAYFIVTVPAFDFLWSDHDVFLEHKRRYTLAGVENMVNAAGLRVEKGFYFFAGVFPAAACLRIMQKIIKSAYAKSQLQKHNCVVNFILKNICTVELLVMKLNRLFGLTVFCLAKKPDYK